MTRMPIPGKISRYLSMILVMASQSSHAGGFSLYTEGSAVEVGNFAAGAAAEAADASIGWYNLAGLVLLHDDQILLSGVGVFPSTTISGSSIYNTEGIPPYTQSFTRLSGGQEAVVPALHLSHRLGPRAVFGFSLVSPFGLSTKWQDSSPVRYSATLTKLTTINASPEMGALLTDHLAVGAGLDLQWANVKFDGVAGSPAALQYSQSFGSPVTPSMLDSSSINQGSSFGVGFHAGLIALFNQNHTRVGLNYQSSMSHRFDGFSELTGPLADPDLTNPTATYRRDDLMSNNTSLPDIVTLSLYHDLNAQWAVLGSVVYTGWSVNKTIELTNVAGYSAESGEQAPLTLITPQDYRNTWRASAGLNYHVNDAWMMRIGGGYDETPTVNAARDVRLPDSSRWALAIGTHYQATPSLGFDLGYSYLFAAGTPSVNSTQVFDSLSSVNIKAEAINHAQLAAVQAVWKFDHATQGKSTLTK